MGWKSNFKRYDSVLSQGFTDRDATPPNTPIFGNSRKCLSLPKPKEEPKGEREKSGS